MIVLINGLSKLCVFYPIKILNQYFYFFIAVGCKYYLNDLLGLLFTCEGSCQLLDLIRAFVVALEAMAFIMA